VLLPVVPVDSFKLKSLVLSEQKGKPLSLRVLVPPNLPSVAPRDKIMVKLEADVAGQRRRADTIDRGRAYWLEPPHLLAAALVESWCGGKLAGMLQLSRDQLAQLLAPLTGEPAVFSVREPQKPLPWEDGHVPGVHEFLAPDREDEAARGTPAPKRGTELTGPRHEASPARMERNLTPMRVDGSTQFVSIELPSRKSAVYRDALELVKGRGFSLDARLKRYFLRGRHETLNFLAEHWQELRDKYRAKFTSNFRKRAEAAIKHARVETTAREISPGHFEVSMRFSAKGLKESSLREALARGARYVEAPNGKIVLIDPEALRQMEAAQQRISGDSARALAPKFTQKVSAAELPAVEAEIAEISPGFNPPQEWARRSKALGDRSSLGVPPMDDALRERLRGYQLLGSAWLWHLHQSRLGGILADEMGLGKTVQAIGLLTALLQGSRSLVACPASLLENWRRELARFAPGLSVRVHHGPERPRTAEEMPPVNVTITSYATLARDARLFAEIPLACAIADEAQHVKNRRTQAAAALRGLHADSRFVLTGTPIENSPDDLTSLFDFLMPGYLKRPKPGTSADERQWLAGLMRERAAPYILRRTKRDVAPELPEKIEETLYCELEGRQAELYRKWEETGRKELEEMERKRTGKARMQLHALNQLMRLRQVCTDPRIVEPGLSAADSAKLGVLTELVEEAEGLVEGTQAVFKMANGEAEVAEVDGLNG